MFWCLDVLLHDHIHVLMHALLGKHTRGVTLTDTPDSQTLDRRCIRRSRHCSVELEENMQGEGIQ